MPLGVVPLLHLLLREGGRRPSPRQPRVCVRSVLQGDNTPRRLIWRGEHLISLGSTRQATVCWRAAATHCWNPRRKLRLWV